MAGSQKNLTITKKIKEGIFLLFICIAGFYIGLNIVSPTKSIDLFGFKPFIVQSDSMKPVFQRGDIIVVTKANTNNLYRDDIIAARRDNGMLIAHYLADQEINENHQLVFKTRPFDSVGRSGWD
ncbi:MAG: S24/S26 family peptidase, partial [Coriobacteriia bacterium]|nr:S24/S26 family peptidase [Coriobacteriia bacterium]